jgi:4-oxalocrotonate tautomerase
MPLVNVQVIENVFSPEQKKQMITKLTDTLVSIEGEALRPYTLVVINEVKEGNYSVGGQALHARDVHNLQKAAA